MQPNLDHQLTPLLDDAIGQLPCRQAQVIIAHYLQGMDESAIASLLCCERTAVERHLYAGLRSLRHHLEGRLGQTIPLSDLVRFLSDQDQPAAPQAGFAQLTGITSLITRHPERDPLRSGKGFTARRVAATLRGWLSKLTGMRPRSAHKHPSQHEDHTLR